MQHVLSFSSYTGLRRPSLQQRGAFWTAACRFLHLNLVGAATKILPSAFGGRTVASGIMKIADRIDCLCESVEKSVQYIFPHPHTANLERSMRAHACNYTKITLHVSLCGLGAFVNRLMPPASWLTGSFYYSLGKPGAMMFSLRLCYNGVWKDYTLRTGSKVTTVEDKNKQRKRCILLFVKDVFCAL